MPASTPDQRIAIVGVGGLFPASPTPARLWDNVLAAADAARPVPPGRWLIDPDEAYAPGAAVPDKVSSRRGCFLDDIPLDPAGLDLPPDLLARLDPVFHLTLHAGRQAFAAGVTHTLDRRRAGVILGNIVLPTEAASRLALGYLGRTFEEQVYRAGRAGGVGPLLRLEQGADAPRSPWYGPSLPAAVLARALGLGGGSFTLDAACASSLYALKLAADELRAGRADAMLAGGVSRPDCLYTQMGFSQLRALSPAGRASPFDARADGLVVGEGAGIFLLKRLADARRDGDRILAVIAGLGLSNDVDGSLLAPSSEGQLRAMRAAYREAGWSPHDVDLIECHATGTPVGDAVEFQSLRALWGPAGWRPGQCVLGSVKSTVGHLLTAAGAAGLTKVLSALAAQALPPTANFATPAPGIDFDGSPFQVLTAPRPWPRRGPGIPRRAAVSAFGFGGINAHLLLEEAPSAECGVPSPEPIVVGARRSALDAPPAIAVVSMEAHFGPWTSLSAFQERVLGGAPAEPHPPGHWWGVPDSAWFRRQGFGDTPFAGFYVEELSVPAGRFRIPPRELQEMLPQQTLMLQVAEAALARVHVPDELRLRTGVFIGLGLDLNTTNYHVRWSLPERARAWADRLDQPLTPAEQDEWVGALRDAAGPALSANRTMGGLGSITASRIAREFRLGGPSFTLSAEENSGLRALDAAVRALQNGDIDQAVVGAVDLAGDVRAVLAAHRQRPFSPGGLARPFDATADGTVTGEGAAALVLKRLDDAVRAGDTIRAVIKGIGVAAGGGIDHAPDGRAYHAALERAYHEAGVDPASVAYVEAHGSGRPAEDRTEAAALARDFGPRPASRPCALGSVKADIGHAGAAAGLASLVKACLCLDLEVLPPLSNLARPLPELAEPPAGFLLPRASQPWPREPAAAPRRAAVSSLSLDGNCVHVVLEAWESTTRSERADCRQPPAARSATSARPIRIPRGGAPFVIPPPPRRRAPALAGVASPAAPNDLTGQVIHAVAAEGARGQAHAAYLRLAGTMNRTLADTIAFQTTLLESLLASGLSTPKPLLDRAQCLEFAAGSIARVLGPDYAEIDTHPTRVRLPDEPLMLVDRILTVEGRPSRAGGTLTGGRVVTEHDIRPGAWYLDGGRVPPSLAIEAGQADLFLAGYLGIDFHTRGRAVYRLLDAVVTFHRGLPGPGETVRYDIRIDRFFRQGDTHLFRFRFEGAVNGTPLLTMTDGCAGFFTAAELAAGRGIVHTALDRRPRGVQPDDARDLPPMAVESYTDEQLDALRAGDLAGCFGPSFAGLSLHPSLRLPAGRLKLVHRVPHVDPHGGRFGLGLIRAEADIDPEAWFLTCHFSDDRVMPGTLMYECCLHTLRIYLLRRGWVAEGGGDVACEPVPGVASRLRCRGQVTAATRTATYEVMLKERGYRPEPYAVVDALLYADGKLIVEITDMSLRLTGLTRESVAATWQRHRSFSHGPQGSAGPALFNRDHFLAFATGKPSEAFGEPYRVFDAERFIARLPGPPYLFLDRITRADAQPWKMAAGGVIEAEYDVPPGAWYFAAQRQPLMPFAVLLEVALQPCGWLAAYLGSALTSPEDLCFRNLGGTADLLEPVGPDAGTLTTRVRITSVTSSAGMIIQGFEFETRTAARPVYRGSTTFGFFTRAALARQVGIRDARPYEPAPAEQARARSLAYPRAAPFPDDRLRMIDRVERFLPDGGPHGLGFIEGSKGVDPDEWFFKAHFYQDPVWPGSLGLESLLQLLRVVARERWPAGPDCRFVAMTGKTHHWTYRGQVIPAHRRVRVRAVVTSCRDDSRELTADGFLEVDGRVIYHMRDFTLKLILM